MSAAVTNLQASLGLKSPPIAIGFLEDAPEGIPEWDGGSVPAGCYFWKKAQQGETFYTTPADHYNCAIGSYTHKIPLPMERSHELEGTIGFMVEKRYLAMAEVPGIPTLKETPAFIAFGPADSVAFTPSVVVITARPAQAMLLYEVALQAGLASAVMPTLGRPACAALPLSLNAGSAALSLGCKGNRTFTGLPDDEMYLILPGDKWPAFLEQYALTAQANDAMGAHYLQHQAKFAVS